MAHIKKIQAWRVEKLDRRRMAWLSHCTHDDKAAAGTCANALLNHGHDARVRSFLKTVLVADPPAPATEAKAHRTAIAMAMSDKADSLKRYKSPG